MRRYGWQIGGVGIAVALVAALALLAHTASGHASVPHERTAVTPRATPTVDVRIAEVEAAAKRYVEVVEHSAKTGDPSEVDKLVVPGSQAEGNAAVTSDFSRENHYNFMANRIDIDETSWQISVTDSVATASFRYSVFGHDADWPSLRPREPDHESKPVGVQLEFEYQGAQWLITQSG